MADEFLKAAVGGVTYRADGTFVDRSRAGRTGERIVGAAHAPHYEAAGRNNVYTACNSAAITFGTALTATGVTFHLHNPAGSGVDLVILAAGASVITCTTAGTLVYAANSPHGTAPATNTAISVYNGRLSASGGKGVAYSVSTLPAVPVAVRVLAGGITAAAVNNIVDQVNGALIVPPTGSLSIQGITIVGTGLCWMTWEEVPIS